MRNKMIKPICVFGGSILGAVIAGKIVGKKKDEMTCLSEKHLSLFLMMNQWVKVKQERKELKDYFLRKGYKKIAIYGMSYVGETLLDELKNSEINVAYGIDKNAGFVCSDVNVFLPEDELEEVDVIVVTAITYFDEIEEKLLEKVSCPIISFEDVLYDI